MPPESTSSGCEMLLSQYSHQLRGEAKRGRRPNRHWIVWSSVASLSTNPSLRGDGLDPMQVIGKGNSSRPPRARYSTLDAHIPIRPSRPRRAAIRECSAMRAALCPLRSRPLSVLHSALDARRLEHAFSPLYEGARLIGRMFVCIQ